MFRRLRATFTLCLAVGLMAGLPAATGGARSAASDAIVTRHVEDLVVISQAATQPAGTEAVSAAPSACADRSYSINGPRWTTAYRWHFRAGSTPAYLSRAAAESTVARAFGNIVDARNDCGRPDRVNATARYLGRTTSAPSCKRTDGRNVVGFRSLPDGVAARACWWTMGNRIVEADVQVSTDVRWAISPVGCVNELMLEAVMTHEAGHVFGMGHVGERRHGRLTMSTYVDGPCNNEESTLGLGDLRGLEALYP